MRTYHAFVGGMSQLTALYPMVEPAYRARGGAMPTATMEEFAKFCASSPYGPVLSPETFWPRDQFPASSASAHCQRKKGYPKVNSPNHMKSSKQFYPCTYIYVYIFIYTSSQLCNLYHERMEISHCHGSLLEGLSSCGPRIKQPFGFSMFQISKSFSSYNNYTHTCTICVYTQICNHIHIHNVLQPIISLSFDRSYNLFLAIVRGVHYAVYHIVYH